jgi:transcriptional regulator with XRE-family HTH domain
MKDLLRGLGGRIKEIRKARGVTQESLAERIEMSPQYLSRIEGGHQCPSVEMLAKLADTLEVEVREFFDFGQPGSIKELRETVRKVTQGANEEQLRLALKVFRAVVR